MGLEKAPNLNLGPIVLDPTTLALYDGAGATVSINVCEAKNVLTVPEQAVLYDKDRHASVWVPDPHGKDGHRVVPIKVGLANGSKVEVLSGLKDGDKVVLQQTS